MNNQTRNIDYEVVIPAYNCASQLDDILKDILQVTKRHKPKKIIIADDGSTDDITKYKAAYYNTSSLPVVNHTTEHKGPFYAEVAGLDRVETPYVIVCHADVRLRGPVEIPKRIVRPKGEVIKIRLWEDTLSVLINHLDKTEDAVGVSCPAISPKHRVGYIVNGRRGLGMNGLPFTVQRKSQFITMLKMWVYEWHEVFSFDTQLFAMRMEAYSKMRYDDMFAPYFLYHDDFFARCRLEGYRTYMTQNCMAYHALNKPKPENSLAVVTQDMYEDHTQKFLDRWNNSPAWTAETLKAKPRVVETLKGVAR